MCGLAISSSSFLICTPHGAFLFYLRCDALTVTWPPTCTLQLFLVDIITVTKANCARPLTYYDSLLASLLSFKAFVLVVLVLAWSVPLALSRWRAFRKWLSVPSHLRSSTARRRSTRRLVPVAKGGKGKQGVMGALRSTDWIKVRVCPCGQRLCPSSCTALKVRLAPAPPSPDGAHVGDTAWSKPDGASARVGGGAVPCSFLFFTVVLRGVCVCVCGDWRVLGCWGAEGSRHAMHLPWMAHSPCPVPGSCTCTGTYTCT
jgi:hypothetical protein